MNWLEELSAGDRVIISRYPDDCLAEVERTTKTQIIVEDMRFRKSDGGLVGGGSYSRSGLVEPTPERVIGCLKRRAIRVIGAKSLDHLDLEALKKILSLIDGGTI